MPHRLAAGRTRTTFQHFLHPSPIGSRHTCLSRYDPPQPRLDHHQQPSHLPIGYRRPDLDQRPFCGVISIKPPQSYSACSPSAALLQCDLYQPLPTTARSLSAAISAHRRISHPAAPSLSANRSVPTPCGVIFINHRQNFHISSTHPPIIVRVRWDTITSCASSVGASVLAKVRSNPRFAPKVPPKNEESRRSPVNKTLFTYFHLFVLLRSNLQHCTIQSAWQEYRIQNCAAASAWLPSRRGADAPLKNWAET